MLVVEWNYTYRNEERIANQEWHDISEIMQIVTLPPNRVNQTTDVATWTNIWERIRILVPRHIENQFQPVRCKLNMPHMK